MDQNYFFSSSCLFFFFFKQKTAYEIMPSLVGSEMCIRDRYTISSWDADKDDCIPYVNEKKVECKDIFIPDVSEDNSYSIITSINIDTAKKIENSVSVLGSSSDVYVSGNNIYLISTVSYTHLTLPTI